MDVGGPALPGPARILQILTAGWVSNALAAAVHLEIPQALAGGPKTPAELADQLKVNPDHLRRLLRALAGNGVFAEDVEKGTYANNSVSEALLPDHPSKLMNVAKLFSHETHQRPWEPLNLVLSLQKGEDSFRHLFKEPNFWKYCDTHPEFAPIFWGAMEGTSTMFHTGMVSTYDFSQFKTVVDVGGGYGTLLARILHQCPTVHGILFDLPDVIAKATIKQDAELMKRTELVGGSFFETVPEGADCYVSTTVLHDWNDEEALKIVRTIHKAAPVGAKLILGETVVPGDSQPSMGKMMDLHMMVICNGKERTEQEWRELLAKGGFKLLRTIRTGLQDFSVVEAERV